MTTVLAWWNLANSEDGFADWLKHTTYAIHQSFTKPLSAKPFLSAHRQWHALPRFQRLYRVGMEIGLSSRMMISLFYGWFQHSLLFLVGLR